MNRIFYALTKGWRLRQEIQKISRQQSIDHITDLTTSYLKTHNIKVLALDFDGVLAAHGESAPRLEVMLWLKGFCEQWPASQVVLLTNKPMRERLTFFQTHFPEMTFVMGFPKKPYPQGLEHIAKLHHCEANEVLLVDDRLLTGILATCLAGTQAVYIRKPYACYWKRPVQEIFFTLLRIGERVLW